jgi:hypothetical protein
MPVPDKYALSEGRQCQHASGAKAKDDIESGVFEPLFPGLSFRLFQMTAQ